MIGFLPEIGFGAIVVTALLFALSPHKPKP
jgi:hypothetical protein